jgi:hypothetical protein
MPVLEAGSSEWLDPGFAAERHDDVDIANEFGIDGLRRFVAEVDP